MLLVPITNLCRKFPSTKYNYEVLYETILYFPVFRESLFRTANWIITSIKIVPDTLNFIKFFVKGDYLSIISM
jgi:hypothetical protein